MHFSKAVCVSKDERSEESAPRTEGTCHLPGTPRGETVLIIKGREREKKRYDPALDFVDNFPKHHDVST